MKTSIGSVFIIFGVVTNICSAQTSPSSQLLEKLRASSPVPEIVIYPDTLFFESTESMDSIYVKSTGDAVLSIDSVLAIKGYGWSVEVTLGDSIFGGSFPYGRLPSFSIEPGDSALLAFYSPDLCPICKIVPTSALFVDTLYVFSNDSLHSPFRIFAHGEGRPSAVEEGKINLTTDFFLRQNYPNPFNPSTRIDFQLPRASRISLKIYNVLGQEIKTLLDDHFQAGRHHVQWDGRDQFAQPVAAGVYLVRLSAGDFVQTKKLTLIR